MSFPLAVLSATAGNVVGSLIAYAGGRSATRLPRARRILEHSERLLGEHPLRAVFTARLLPLARTFVSLPAGARRLPLAPFTALTAAGCAIWATAFVLAGVSRRGRVVVDQLGRRQGRARDRSRAARCGRDPAGLPLTRPTVTVTLPMTDEGDRR